MNLLMKKYKIILICYLLTVSIFFAIFIRDDSYLSNPAYRFYADTLTYYKLSNMNIAIQSMVGLTQNFLGPLLIIALTGKKLIYAFIFNLILFICSIKLFFVTYEEDIDKNIFTCYLLLNLLLFASLLLVNKEIFALSSILFFLIYNKKKDKRILFLSLMFAFFARWQHLLIYIIYFFFKSKLNPFKRENIFSIFLMILFINTFYTFFFAKYGNVYSVGTMIAQKEKAGLLINTLKLMEENYMYGFALPVKILLNLAGNITRVPKIFILSYILEDVYNNLFILGHQIATIFLVYKMVIKRKINLNNDAFFLSSLFCIFYSMSSMIQYRYYYIVYVLWVFVLAEKRSLDNSQVSDGTK